jgi:voltage-gated sodium channel
MLQHLFIYSEEAAQKVDRFFETKPVHLIISLLVFINAFIFAFDAIPTIKERYEGTLELLDQIILGIFIVEMVSRMMVTRGKFFKNYWNVFDLIVTAISLLPASYGLRTIRVLRVLHSMRLLEILPKTKHIMDGLAHAIPGLLNVLFLSFVFYFVFSIMAVGLLGPHLPGTFGDLGSAMYHLFSVMTSGIWIQYASQIPEQAMHVTVFFVSFMVIVGYLIVNVFVGSVVSAVAKAEREIEGLSDDSLIILQELKTLREEMRALQKK